MEERKNGNRARMGTGPAGKLLQSCRQELLGIWVKGMVLEEERRQDPSYTLQIELIKLPNGLETRNERTWGIKSDTLVSR